MHCDRNTAKLLRRRGYRQDARHSPAAGRLDQDLIHQESSRLCRLSRRSDRKHYRDVDLRSVISEHRYPPAGSLGLEAPRSLNRAR